jgi:flagellar basal-body rod protein FlgB
MSVTATMFNKGSTPVLEQALSFLEKRHQLIARNIANVETPGYTPLDLDEQGFRSMLRKSLQARDAQPVGAFQMLGGFGGESYHAEVIKRPGGMRNGENKVDLDNEMSLLARNAMEYRVYASVLMKKNQLLRDTIAERA